MDWNRAIGEERVALMRIVDLLRALAGLAELAAGRSPAVRAFLLWLLRYAEAVARDFVAGCPSTIAHGPSPVLSHETRLASMPAGPADEHQAEACRLAMSLRALALQLAVQATLVIAMRGAGGADTQLPLDRLSATHGVANALAILAAFARRTSLPAPDTS